MNKNFLLFFSVFFHVILAGCVAPAPEKTPLEIQAMQTRTFEASPRDVFRSARSTLQDNSYNIKSTDEAGGFMVAESPLKNNFNSPKVGGLLGGLFIDASELGENKKIVNVTVEEITAKSTRLRLNFVEQVKMGSDINEIPIQDPESYRDIFVKIEQNLFVRKATK
jgi:hypothetical protein